MENTLVNKEKFFALYIRQRVLVNNFCTESANGVVTITALDYLHNTEMYCYLMLKPLSSITDEDAIEVAKLFWKEDKYHTIKNGKYYVGTINQFHENPIVEYGIEMYPHNALLMCDFLRSKGYALPFLDLSVSELINYGWVKLKEN